MHVFFRARAFINSLIIKNNPDHIVILIENEKFHTDTHSTNSDFRAFANGIHDRKIIYVYGERHERSIVYFTLVHLAGRQSP